MSDYWHDQFYKLEEEHVKLHSALEAAQRERDQANEAVKVLSEGKPLGPIIGSHTIVNQALEIKRLTKELEASQEENKGLREVLEEILEALRIHAPGTPLNNHRFDALGIKAYAALALSRTEKKGTP